MPASIYLKSRTQTYGDFIADNIGRATNKNTVLTSIGFATVTNAGPSFVSDGNAQFPSPDLLAGIRLVLDHNTVKTWPITGNDAVTVNVDVSNDPLTAQIGQSFRGLYRFDSTKLRNARLEVLDLLEGTIDKDASSVVLGSNLPPVLTPSLITLQTNATGASIIGNPGAAVDPDQPLVLTATNTTSGVSWTLNAAANGSFTIPVQGNAGDAITLKGRDSNYFPLESPLLNVGTLAADTPPPTQLDRTAWTTDAAFRARGLAIDERSLVIWGGGTDKLAILSLADPKRPQFVRTVDVNNGPISRVALTGGWAVIGSNDLAVLNLGSTTSTPVILPDETWSENTITVAAGWAFTAPTFNNDGRIRIYDVSSPGSARYLREQVLGPSGVTWDALASYGNYLIGITNAKPGGAGQDVVVIDRTNIYGLVKVATLDIPTFDATSAFVSGSRLYVTSSASRDLVIVDLTNPKAPAVLGRITLPANASRAAVLNTTAFVADTSAGLVEVDASNPAAPVVVNTLATGGTAYDVALASPTVYVANDIGLAVHPIAAPPQIEPSRVSMSASGTTVTITGTERAITGSGAITVQAINVTTGATGTASVSANGSFSVSVSGLTNEAIAIEATDSANRKSGRVSLGLVPFGGGVTFTPFTSAIAGQGNYHARTIATDGTHLVLGGFNDGGSTRLVVFDVTDPAAPVFKRSVAINNGPINNVAIHDGYAIVAANDLTVLDLGSDTSAPVTLADQTWTEFELLVRDGYAFTAPTYNDDGRIRIYDVSRPASAHYIREQVMGPANVTWTGLAAFGSRYLVATAGGTQDVVVIDRSNAYALTKVATLDIPSFSGFRGRVLGNTFYLAGTGGGVAVVDLSNPAAPVLKTILATGDARGIDVAGATVAVANDSAGVTFLNADDPNAPAIYGTQFVGGSAWSVAFNRDNIYVANDQGLAVIRSLVTAPIVDPERISITPESGTLATIAGAPDSITGLAPFRVEVTNTTTGASISNQRVESNGSFSVLFTAMTNETLSVEATDAAGRKSGRVAAGRVPFGSNVSEIAINAALTGQNYHARTLATDGTHLVVGGYGDDGTTKIVIFDVTNPAVPQYRRTVAINNGAIHNVGISNGWAVVAANDLTVLDLSSNTSSPVRLPDETWTEAELLVAGGYAFTAPTYNSDGRIRIYDVSRPSAARYIREQVLGPGDAIWRGLAVLDANHILAFGDNAAYDVAVIERSNIHNLVKRAQIDIPNFDAFRGKVIGTTLYLGGTNGGLAIVDVSNPAAPVVLKVMKTAGSPFGADGAGGLLAVADGGSGVTFVDINDPANAFVIGTQPVGGTAWSVAFNKGSIYVANEHGLAVIANVGAAPIVAPSLITISTDGAGNATITGAPSAISGVGALVIEARNAESGDTVSNRPVNADGSFTVTIAAHANDLLTIEATDEVGRKSGRTPVGTVPFGTVSTVLITPSMSAAGYRPRTLATDGTHLIIGGYNDDATTRLVIFDVSDPTVPPVFQRSVAMNRGTINNVAIQDGWAIVAANDLVVLNLNNPASTPVALPDETWTEFDLAVSGGYAFTSPDYNNDGRIRIYDVSNPAYARYVREQVMGLTSIFTGLTAVGDNYIVASGSASHDVVVIDRRNVYGLVKVADLDIPNFDGYRGTAIGTTLFLGGTSGGLAIVDLSNPAQPVVRAVLQTAGDAFGADATGSTLAVADGSAGITFFDVTDPFAPQLLGTNSAGGGTVWSAQFSRGSLYAVNEQALLAIRNVTVPVIERSLISIATATSTAITVTGTAGAIGGVAPFSVEVRNTTTNATSGNIGVAANGSFTASLAAVPKDQLTLIVTDGGGRTSTLSLGASPFGTLTTQPATPAQAGGDTGFRARRIASNGTATITGTGSTSGIGIAQSGNVVVYREGLVKKYDAGTAINDIAIHNGYALIAGNDLASLNLADPNATPYIAPDHTWSEMSITAAGNNAFTAPSYNDDGRIRVYDVSNPAKPAYVGEKAWIAGVTWEKLVAFGTYLVAISADAPGGVGHDVVLFDATNRSALVKLADYDIPSFGALDGVVDGTTLYLAGGNAGVAIVDIATLTTPSPSVTIIDTPGNARGIDVSGTNEIAVADGSAGVTIIDTTNRLQPVIRGTQALDSTNTVDVTVSGRTIYAAADGYVHTISRPE